MSPSVTVVEGNNDEKHFDHGPNHDVEPTDVEAPRSTLRSIVIVLTCTFAMIVNAANSTAMAISLSTVGRELGIPEIQLQWLVSAYTLSSGCLLLVFGRIADLHGRKKTFVFGTLLLAVFTLGCGFAENALTLDILRGFQGIGVAATIPASLGILAHAFPPSRARAVAFSTFGAGAPVGAAIGTALGGVLTEVTKKTWRSPFYLETGLTVLCLIGGIVSFDPDVPSTELDKRVDWLGALLVTAGLVLITFVLAQGEVAPQRWKTPYILALLVTGVLLLVLFVLWQRYLEKLQTRIADVKRYNDDSLATTPASTPPPPKRSWLSPPPLMKVSLWGRAKGRFAVMMCVAFLEWCSFLSWIFWAQLYYQNYLQLSPVHTVLRLLPMFVSGIICNVLVALLVARVPTIYLITLGTLGTSMAGLLFALIKPNATFWAFGFPAAVISVFGADFVFSAGTLFIAKIAEPHEQSLAGALFQTMTQIGTSLGVTVTTVIFNRAIPPKDSITEGVLSVPTLSSYQAAQWGSFAFGILAMLLAIISFRGVGVIGHK